MHDQADVLPTLLHLRQRPREHQDPVNARYDPMPEPLGTPEAYGPPGAQGDMSDELDDATIAAEKQARDDDTEEDDRQSKRRRMMSLNQVMEKVLAMGAKATKEEVAKIMESLDKREIKKIKIDCERKQRRQHGNNDRVVSEAYSPPRTMRMGYKHGLNRGTAMDLTTKDDDGNWWDCTVEAMRDKAEKKLAEEQPGLLILSPPCTAFCIWQNINYPKMPLETVRRKLAEGIQHIGFAMKLAVMQAEGGRKFVFEHPVGASNWGL